MKKTNIPIFCVLLCILCLPIRSTAQDIVPERLAPAEIQKNKSYKAAAYNFVYAFLFRDVDALFEMIDAPLLKSIGGKDGLSKLVNNPQFKDITPMRSVIPLGYTPAITKCDELNVSNYGEEYQKRYKGVSTMNVRIDCFNDEGQKYNDEYGDYSTNVRVMLAQMGGVWKIIGFK